MVNEYRLYTGVCRCCQRAHPARLPQGVPSGQIGPRALGLVGMLGTRFQMPQMKIRDLMAQLLGVRVHGVPPRRRGVRATGLQSA